MRLKCSHGNCNQDAIACFREVVQIRAMAACCNWHAPKHGFCSVRGQSENLVLMPRTFYRTDGLCKGGYESQGF